MTVDSNEENLNLKKLMEMKMNKLGVLRPHIMMMLPEQIFQFETKAANGLLGSVKKVFDESVKLLILL